MSFNVYPIQKTDLVCEDYEVKVNGKVAALNSARVSAMPMNRRWPGHQREIEQSELINFLSLATDEPLSFEITPKTPFEEVKIRPKSLNITPEITDDGKIRFTLPRAAYFTVEPYGRNRALHIFADPIAEYDIDINAPDVLYYGAGEHDVGLIELKANQTLFIDEGAVVYARIHAIDADNIKILGRGILDNSRNKEKILFEVNAEGNDSAVSNAKREHTVVLEYCDNVVIDGITIRDSLVYNIRPIGCENLSIKHVKIIGCWRFNSDGIDMHNCVNVHIAKCFIRTFDDSICVKGFDFYNVENQEEAIKNAMYHNGKVHDVFKNVLVEDCVIWNDWGNSLEIGAETKAEEIHTVTFQNCDIIHLTGAALDCFNVDYADVHDIVYRDINIEADEVIPAPVIQQSDGEVYVNPDPNYMPYTVRAKVEFHYEYSGGMTRRGKNRNITFKNIHVYSDKLPRAQFFGYDEDHKTENILVSNLYLNGKPITKLEGENWNIGDFTENIRLEYDPYAQMDKNDVDAKDQLKESAVVRFENPDFKGKRVMFVGNSITLHGIRPQIGWYGEWGMAASAQEKDYVHLLMSDIRKIDSEAAFCTCQVSGWEQNYKEKNDDFTLYESASNFGADIIVLRFIENVKKDDYDSELFLKGFDALVKFLDKEKKAKLIITTAFWHHPGDDDLRMYAKEHNIPCVELGDLGDDDKMKATGLFEHKGVAHHPGDEGMRAIADRVMKALIDSKYL
ncbi:MAG: hypothetical protein E7410_00270 [Ruminococcaceae bacterium]|nr:hypothetical protein [Oscillospiraceae bacterium]